MKKQAGFTLIELIMVIVILGILSAFALPRFADLSGNAETAANQGIIGALRSASAIGRAACLADSACSSSGADTVNLEGSAFNTYDGYIASTTPLGIEEAAQIAGFTATRVARTATTGGTASWALNGTCVVIYTEAFNDGTNDFGAAITTTGVCN